MAESPRLAGCFIRCAEQTHRSTAPAEVIRQMQARTVSQSLGVACGESGQQAMPRRRPAQCSRLEHPGTAGASTSAPADMAAAPRAARDLLADAGLRHARMGPARDLGRRYSDRAAPPGLRSHPTRSGTPTCQPPGRLRPGTRRRSPRPRPGRHPSGSTPCRPMTTYKPPLTASPSTTDGAERGQSLPQAGYFAPRRSFRSPGPLRVRSGDRALA